MTVVCYLIHRSVLFIFACMYHISHRQYNLHNTNVHVQCVYVQALSMLCCMLMLCDVHVVDLRAQIVRMRDLDRVPVGSGYTLYHLSSMTFADGSSMWLVKLSGST